MKHTIKVQSTSEVELTRAAVLSDRMSMRNGPEDRRIRLKYAALHGLQRMSGVEKFTFSRAHMFGRG